MKTSNILLIALLLFLPLSMVAYNFMLKEEYEKGNIRRVDRKNNMKLSTHTLKPFRHLVFNGGLWVPSGDGTKRAYGEHQRMELTIRKGSAPYLQTSNKRSKDIRIHQQNDTLFISYEVTRLTEGDDRGANFLMLYTSELASVTGDFCSMEIDSLSLQAPLRVQVGSYSECTINGAELPGLDLILQWNAVCNLNKDLKVGTLAYQLGENAAMKISGSMEVNTIQAGKIDSSASITLAGKAVDMEDLLQKF